MKNNLLACLYIAIMFFIVVQQERLNAEREELKSEEARIIYLLTKANKEVEFTIKRFQQLQKLIPLKEYCERYNYRGRASYDGELYFPCQMLNPKNKIRVFNVLELVSDVAREGLASNKLQ